ncbi:MAG: hypothetical protein JRH18_16880 [Deltaproteobacteria bacterium]|nr:hypothetical protein [Deltaproteobacteria bacterium]MBW2153332.1 hypothetical protein [Deltaproteobacteria bacterium]
MTARALAAAIRTMGEREPVLERAVGGDGLESIAPRVRENRFFPVSPNPERAASGRK